MGFRSGGKIFENFPLNFPLKFIFVFKMENGGGGEKMSPFFASYR